jgi:nucleoside-diphosphate-sugar epimerase
MKKIVLTGGTGFVGKNLINSFQKDKCYEMGIIDFRKNLPEKLAPFDSLIHLAGKAHDLKKNAKSEEYFEVNYEKTKVLYDLFLESEGKDFIYFSSVKAVADTLNGELFENHEPDPQTPYGQSKLKAERYLLNQPIPDNKRLFILRPCMIHGPGNKGNLNLLYNLVNKGVPYPLGAFANRRSFLSIDNLIYIIKRIINEPLIPGGKYNLADDVPLSTNELIKIIATSSASSGRIWNLPKKLILGITRLGDILHLPLNSENLKKLTESYVVSNQKLKTALKINQLPLSTQDGLVKTINAFKSR